MSISRRVLVTGGTGFLGTPCLQALLARGYEVHATSRHAHPIGIPPEVMHHPADLLSPTDRSALLSRVRPTHLLHLAWYVAHGKFWEAPENLAWVSATLALIEEFATHGGTRAVMAGTCIEYDPSHGPCNEFTTPLVPKSLYGICKHSISTIAERYLGNAGVQFAWGRVFFLYGPGETPTRLVPSIARSLLRGEPALCTHGRQVRDFMHVHDAANAFAALVDSPVVGAVNIASGEPRPVADLVETLGAASGRPDLIRLGAIPLAASEPLDFRADVGRLQREVGFRPEINLEAGLEACVEWWRSRV
jgi:nucleoside-diphosphate-sugar epimerase